MAAAVAARGTQKGTTVSHIYVESGALQRYLPEYLSTYLTRSRNLRLQID